MEPQQIQQTLTTDLLNKARYIIGCIDYRWECYNLGITNCEQMEGTFNQKMHQMAQEINTLNCKLLDLKIPQHLIRNLSAKDNKETQIFFNQQPGKTQKPKKHKKTKKRKLITNNRFVPNTHTYIYILTLYRPERSNQPIQNKPRAFFNAKRN